MSAGQPGRRELPPTPVAMLEVLIDVAHRYGRDPEFSRGGGGNASAKVDGVLFIKPSGVALATLTADELVTLDIGLLLEMLRFGDAPPGADETIRDPVMRAAMAARLGHDDGRRPSVELLFHAFLPERFILHTHAVEINAVTCHAGGKALAQRLLADKALWVPYADPGLPLARAIVDARRVFEERTGRSAPAVTLMQNHGLIIGGDSAEEIDQRSAWLLEKVRGAQRRPSTSPREPRPAGARPGGIDTARTRALVDVISPSLRGLLAGGDTLRVVTFDEGRLAAAFAATPAGRAVVLGGPLTPDQIVYSGSWPLLVDVPDDIQAEDLQVLLDECLRAHLVAHGTMPIIVVVPGLGLFAAGNSWSEADTARHVYLDSLRVAERALFLGGVRALSETERTFIETWEAENYRRAVAVGTAASGRLAGRVALVTGAAQGFGLAIAADLVAQGGHVVLADLNATLAEANARELEGRFGPGRAWAVAMNVTDEQSVADGLHATVVRYGGLDLLVSNAGCCVPAA